MGDHFDKDASSTPLVLNFRTESGPAPSSPVPPAGSEQAVETNMRAVRNLARSMKSLLDAIL